MSKIVLRSVAVTDLNTRYARSMGGNKIRHYKVPYSQRIAGGNPLDMIKEYILREEKKEASEVEIVVEAVANLLPPMNADSLFHLEEVTSSVLAKDNKVLKALKQLKSNTLSVQTVDSTRLGKLRNKIATWINDKIFKLNNYFWPTIFDVHFEGESNGKIPYIPIKEFERHVHLTHYISVAFEGPEYVEAQSALLADLRKLTELDLIMGHLTMPSLMALADTVGTAVQPYVLFCFPIINHKKLNAMFPDNIAPLDALAQLGIKYETPEGGISSLNGVDINSKYEIEEVIVLLPETLTHEQVQDKVQDAFAESIPTVNRAAEATRKLLKEYGPEFTKAQFELDQAVAAMKKIVRNKAAPKKKAKKKPTKKTAKKSARKTSKKNGKKTKKA